MRDDGRMDAGGRLRGGEAVLLLDADPALAVAIGAEAAAQLRPYAIVSVLSVDRGAWTPPGRPDADARALGYLVLDGLLTRGTRIAGQEFTELLGAGDVLQPWHHAAPATRLHASVGWTVLEPSRLAVLDRAFAAVAARRPELMVAVTSRVLERSRALAEQATIAQLTGVELRLQVMLWHLADRWGHDRDGHVELSLPLTHDILARLVRARRPTVTTALGTLADRGLVTRSQDGGWLLHGEPPGMAVT